MAAARIAHGLQEKLYLGNLNALRDWGYAADYADCMWRILQHDRPDDWVIATGVSHSVREFASLAFERAGLTIEWSGQGVDEIGVEVKTGRELIRVDRDYYRPTEVDRLQGDPSKAVRELGWNPSATSFEKLVEMMVESDMQLAAKEKILRGKG